jgi:hypothetical protein
MAAGEKAAGAHLGHHFAQAPLEIALSAAAPPAMLQIQPARDRPERPC